MTRFERIAYKIGIIAVVIYVIAMAAIATQTYLTAIPQKLHQTYASSTHRMTMIKGSQLISNGIASPC